MEPRPIQRGKHRPYAVWLQKRADTGTWRIRWVDPDTGQRCSETCGTDSAFARDRRDAKVAELRAGHSGRTDQHRLGELAAAVGGWMVGRSATSAGKARRAVEALRDACGNLYLHRIQRGHLMDLRGHLLRKHAPATVNSYMRSLRSALSYARDAGWLRENPARGWKGIGVPEPEPSVRVVEPAEFEKLVSATAVPGIRLLLVVAYYQGLRRAELCHLRWESIDLAGGTLRVINVAEADELTKSRRNRAIALRVPCREVLQAWWEEVEKIAGPHGLEPKYPHVVVTRYGRPYTPDRLTHVFQELVETSGIRHCTLHDLRRSFSTLAQRAGLHPSMVQALGGWSSLAVVRKHYTGDVTEAHRKAMEFLDAGPGVAPKPPRGRKRKTS